MGNSTAIQTPKTALAEARNRSALAEESVNVTSVAVCQWRQRETEYLGVMERSENDLQDALVQLADGVRGASDAVTRIEAELAKARRLKCAATAKVGSLALAEAEAREEAAEAARILAAEVRAATLERLEELWADATKARENLQGSLLTAGLNLGKFTLLVGVFTQHAGLSDLAKERAQELTAALYPFREVAGCLVPASLFQPLTPDAAGRGVRPLMGGTGCAVRALVMANPASAPDQIRIEDAVAGFPLLDRQP